MNQNLTLHNNNKNLFLPAIRAIDYEVAFKAFDYSMVFARFLRMEFHDHVDF
jgi:hypothetical protein